jgi:hypothetical protein
MAAGPRLDAAGQAKIKTLDEALLLLQRVNGLVEQYALAIKAGRPGGVYIQNIRRTLPSLSENLKGHFGMISDQITSVNLSVGRGASDVVRVRQLREGVAQIKQALEIAFAQTKAKHTVEEEPRNTNARE